MKGAAQPLPARGLRVPTASGCHLLFKVVAPPCCHKSHQAGPRRDSGAPISKSGVFLCCRSSVRSKSLTQPGRQALEGAPLYDYLDELGSNEYLQRLSGNVAKFVIKRSVNLSNWGECESRSGHHRCCCCFQAMPQRCSRPCSKRKAGGVS